MNIEKLSCHGNNGAIYRGLLKTRSQEAGEYVILKSNSQVDREIHPRGTPPHIVHRKSLHDSQGHEIDFKMDGASVGGGSKGVGAPVKGLLAIVDRPRAMYVEEQIVRMHRTDQSPMNKTCHV